MDRYMLTASGRRIDLPLPKPGQITIRDIATHLSRLPRFVGATTRFYSVAQHSAAVGALAVGVAGLYKDRSLTEQEWLAEGLMHDATEFITGDLPSPIKAGFKTQWMEMVRPIEAAIRREFNLSATEPNVVWIADRIMLQLEMELLVPGAADDQYIPQSAMSVLQQLRDGHSPCLAEAQSILHESLTPDHAYGIFMDYWAESQGCNGGV